MIQFTDGTSINHCFCYMDKKKKCTHIPIDLQNTAPVYIKTIKTIKKENK